MEFLVTRADNTTYSLPDANSKIISGEQNRVLMGEDTLSMVVESVGYINFQIGDWIEAYGYKYTLNTLGEPERLAENRFKYSLKFEGVKYQLTKVIYRSADYTGFNPSSDFSLTGNVENFLTVLQYNLERAFGVGTWAVGSFPATDAKTLSFASENCLLVLNRLCEEFDTEYEIITVGGVNTISITEAGSQLPFSLEYGKGKGLYSLIRTNVDSKNVITRLYVEGSDKNIKAGYRENSLRLRIAANTESYIDSPAAASFGIIEGSKIFDDIFPHREGTVSAINADKQTFVDTGMDFDLNETDTNGTKWLIAGQSAKIHFNTGNLAGYSFDLVSYNHSTKTFKIKSFQDERGLQFPNPDSAAFQIGVGDKYVILDIIMPQAYITAAETELATKGQEYLEQNDQPRVEYALSLDRFYLKDTFGSGGTIPNILNDGDFIHILDNKIGVDKNVRVKSFTRNLIDPFTYSVTLSDVIEPTRIERLISDTTENKKAAQRNKMFDPARSRRNWRDIEEVTGMVETLRAEMALIGTSEGQFQVSSFFEVNKNGNENLFGATAGVLVHDAYQGGSNGIWNMGALEVALSQNQPYYLYAQCSRTTSTGVFTVSLTKIGVEDDATYYHFPVGLISSVRDEARTLTTIYGYTLISGNNITTGIIQNDQSGIMINLQTGEIRGAFTFSSGQLVETALNGKNTRYTQGTDPAAAWNTTELQQAHVNDIWAKILPDAIEEYYYTEITTGVYGWVLNETEINGGRIKAGTIDASRIDVEGLFAEEINATNFNLEKGKIGAFEVDTILRSENSEGKGIYINPAEYEISIENKAEGLGVSSVNMRAGSLTPYLLLAGGSAGTYQPTADSNYIATNRTSIQLRATGGTNLPALYLGKNSTTAGLASSSIPANANKIPLVADKNYAVDLRYLFNIRHSGGSANDRVYKLQGYVNVSVTATLYGVTSGGVTKVLTTSIVPIRKIERSDQRTGDDIYPISVKTSFSSQDCVYAYWKLDINLAGTLTYQRWSNDYLWKYYWETKTEWAIEFRHQMGALSSFFPSVGVTELTTSGFQTVWATNRYFRIDGEDSGSFIRSAGVWTHNGYEVATADDINTITADLTNYVLINDLQAAYYNMTQSDGRYALKAGDGTQDFAVKDLTIHGTVNHWLADVITVADARLQLNRTQDAATVASGLDIYNGTSVVSSLLYDTSGIWRAGGQRIYTDAYKPLADNATNLGGYSAASYPRKAENAVVTGAWNFRFQSGISNITLESAAGTEGGGLDRPYFDFKSANGNILRMHYYGDAGKMRFERGDNRDAIGLELNYSTGNVGIGLTWAVAPSERLHVAGNGLFEGDIKLPTGGIDIGTRNGDGLRFRNNDAFKIYFSQSSDATLGGNLSGTADYNMYFRSEGGAGGGRGWAFKYGSNIVAQIQGNGSFSAIGNLAISGTSTLTGAVTAGGNVTAPTFVSGFAGSGWRLEAGAENHLTIDRLTVRGRMDIYELVVNQIRGTNGALWVSDSAKVASVSGARLTIDTGGDTSFVPFVVNDLLRCQKWNGNNVKYYVVRVTAVGSNYIDVTLVAGSSPREAGDQLVRMGNTTVTDRQGALYLTSSDSNAPYLDVLDGVNSASFAGKTKVRLGKLNGITDADLGTLTGYGLYSENAYLKGKIIANSGLIGGWDIAANRIRSSSQTLHLSDQYNRIAVTAAASDNPSSGGRVQMYNAGGNNWGLWGSVDGINPIFRLGGVNSIAGINFDDSKIYTSNWELNKDGSFSFANGKISGTSAGVLTIDGGVVTGEIKSSNYNGLVGSLLSLNDGSFQIGGKIRVDAVTNQIVVKDGGTGQDGVKIGDFTMSGGGGGSTIDNAFSGSITTNATSSDISLDGVVTATGLSTESLVIHNGLVQGAYNLKFNVKVNTLSRNSQSYSTSPAAPWDSNGLYGSATTTITIYLAGDIIYSSTKNCFSTEVTHDINISFEGSGLLRCVVTINGTKYWQVISGSNKSLFGYYGVISTNSARITLTPSANVLEISSKGFQSYWGASRFFRLAPPTGWANFITARGQQEYISPNGTYRLKVSDAGIQKSINGGSTWTSL